jgi:hypothetical protein
MNRRLGFDCSSFPLFFLAGAAVAIVAPGMLHAVADKVNLEPKP